MSAGARTQETAGLRRMLVRPEVGAAAGALLVWLVFAAVAGPALRSLEGTAAFLNAAAPLGILAVAVALLMIAGEFDLSVGSIIGVAGMTIMLLTKYLETKAMPGGGQIIRTGPSFVTKENAADVIALAERGIR